MKHSWVAKVKASWQEGKEFVVNGWRGPTSAGRQVYDARFWVFDVGYTYGFIRIKYGLCTNLLPLLLPLA